MYNILRSHYIFRVVEHYVIAIALVFRSCHVVNVFTMNHANIIDNGLYTRLYTKTSFKYKNSNSSKSLIPNGDRTDLGTFENFLIFHYSP